MKSTKRDFNSAVKQILLPMINVKSLFGERPDLFDLAGLTLDSKLTLLISDPFTFSDLIDLNQLDLKDKETIVDSHNHALIKKIKFSDKELMSMKFTSYMTLLGIDFDLYIREDIYNKLSNENRFKIFLLNSDWVMSTIGVLPRLSSVQLGRLIDASFIVFEKYVTDFSSLKTNSGIWRQLIKKDRKYKKIFLENINTCITKTDVRQVIWDNPDLIFKLNSDIIDNSKLTCKEWALLISTVVKANEKKAKFRDWVMPDDLLESLKLGTTMEALSGESTATKRLSTAFKKISGEIDEDVGE